MASINTSTGYGPRNRLFYSGNPTDYQMWETRFTNYLYTLDIKLYKAALPKEDSVQDEEDFHISNRRTYAELVQVLDERSLQLIMADAANDGRKALKVLRQHYASTEKPRVLSLYEELTTLRLNDTEDITGYLIRAERAATGLRTSGEQISDNLVIAMILKGLPETYKPFVVVHTQLDKIKTLSEFKSALNTYANTEAMRSPPNTALVTHSNSKWSSTNRNPRTAPPTSDTRIQCLACGNTGHKARNCSQDRASLFCDHCQIIGHVEAICQKRKRLFNQNKSNVNVVTTTPNTAHPSTSFHFVVNASEAHNGAPGNTPSRKLLVDTGATTHIVNSPDRFIAYDSTFAPKEHTIEVADGRRSNQLVTARGDAEFMITDATGKSQTVILHNALLAPSFPVSLFSVQAATEAGAVAIFSKGNNTIQSGDTIFNLVQHGKLYFLEDRQDGAYTTRTIQEWHRCLGHMNHEDINQLQACTQGMSIAKSQSVTQTCTTCNENKATRLPKATDDAPVHATKPLQRVHTDITGPIMPISREGFKYIINFVDEYSSILFVYFLRSKDEATTALKQFLADVAPVGQPQEIHSDNGGEYVSKSFQTVLVENQIKYTSTAPYTPYQNGKSERSWRSLLEMARCLLSESGITKPYWTYAVRHAQYLRNRSFQRRTKSTAYELFTRAKPDMRKIYEFGCACTYYNESHKQKLDVRGYPGYYLGVNTANHSYYILDSQCSRIITTRNVRIHKPEYADEKAVEEHEELWPPCNVNTGQNDDTPVDITVPQVPVSPQPTDGNDQGRPRREHKTPARFSDYVLSANVDYAYTAFPLIPNTYDEATNSKQAHMWKAAMDKEVTTLCDNNTWEVTPLPKGCTETKGRWVYTLKQGKMPDQVQYKARYVARGFTQVQGVDYDETFSPTTRFTSIRALLQKATNENLVLHQLDVKGAYLNAPIDKELYIQQPPGYEMTANRSTRLTCRLNKSIYGLKQSGRMWYETLTDYLKANRFVANVQDPCLYTRGRVDNDDYAILVFWVDDIIVGGKTDTNINSVKTLLQEKFNMDDRGQLQWFLGIDFKRLNDGRYQINQQRYAEQILKRYGMAECKPASTPSGSDTHLQKATDDEHEQVHISKFPYREIVGSLIYLMTATRPDISWSVSKLSQYLDKPGPAHVTAVKRLLRYIKATLSHTLIYSPSDGVLRGYSDSDWAGDTDDRRSTTGFVTTLGSCPISWKTRKQPSVALSSCEAEYMALSDTTREMLYLRTFCLSLDLKQPEQNIVLSDNQGAIALSKGHGVKHSRSKHIDIRYHFVREQTTMLYKYVSSDNNLADIMTKPLDRIKHDCALKQLGFMIEGAC